MFYTQGDLQKNIFLLPFAIVLYLKQTYTLKQLLYEKWRQPEISNIHQITEVLTPSAFLCFNTGGRPTKKGKIARSADCLLFLNQLQYNCDLLNTVTLYVSEPSSCLLGCQIPCMVTNPNLGNPKSGSSCRQSVTHWGNLLETHALWHVRVWNSDARFWNQNWFQKNSFLRGIGIRINPLKNFCNQNWNKRFWAWNRNHTLSLWSHFYPKIQLKVLHWS